MIHVHKLVKRYGDTLAVDGVSFDVAKGEVVGFLGPNGAGKSTTLRILAGFLGMTSGEVSIAGHDVTADSLEARRKVGYMPEGVPLYPEMRVREYLAFRAELKCVARGARAAAVIEAMRKANVDDVAGVRIGHLSKGYRQRVGLADALVARPPLLVLDEPTAGLDPNQILAVRDVIRNLGSEHTVLLSTHILSEVEAICSRVLVIARGVLVAEGTMDDLAGKRVAEGVVLRVRGDRAEILRLIRGIAAVDEVILAAGSEDAFRASFAPKTEEAVAARATEEAVAALVGAGCFVREVRPIRSSLEEVFGELTRDGSPRRASDGDGDDHQAAAS